jgi:hypothetical protein
LRIETTECPFCRARITPIEIGDTKQCPVCKRQWFEGGWGAKNKTDTDVGGGTGGGGIVVASTC